MKWKKLKWFTALPNGKISNRESGKYLISTKWKKWSNVLHFSTYLTSFPQSGKTFHRYHLFPRSGKKVQYIFYFIIPIFFIFPKWIIYFTSAVFFQEVENISPMHHISLKFTNVSNKFHYYQIVKNVIDRSRNMCL